jgi:hypothetical protein
MASESHICLTLIGRWPTTYLLNSQISSNNTNLRDNEEYTVARSKVFGRSNSMMLWTLPQGGHPLKLPEAQRYTFCPEHLQR